MLKICLLIGALHISESLKVVDDMMHDDVDDDRGALGFCSCLICLPVDLRDDGKDPVGLLDDHAQVGSLSTSVTSNGRLKSSALSTSCCTRFCTSGLQPSRHLKAAAWKQHVCIAAARRDNPYQNQQV